MKHGVLIARTTQEPSLAFVRAQRRAAWQKQSMHAGQNGRGRAFVALLLRFANFLRLSLVYSNLQGNSPRWYRSPTEKKQRDRIGAMYIGLRCCNRDNAPDLCCIANILF